MKIYTRSGDSGQTSLLGGGRVLKTHPRVEAYGAVDELNSLLGVARAHAISEYGDGLLAQAQSQLFLLGADLATPPDSAANWITRISAEDIAWLEATIDEMTAELPALKNFILPGGTLAAASLQLARTVCRRAERQLVALLGEDATGEQALAYLNRLSDWLFTLARYENLQAGETETTWRLR